MTLTDQLPETAGPDELFDTFVAWADRAWSCTRTRRRR